MFVVNKPCHVLGHKYWGLRLKNQKTQRKKDLDGWEQGSSEIEMFEIKTGEGGEQRFFLWNARAAFGARYFLC